MQLIVTRPETDAAHLVEKLASKGHQVLSAPMISIAYFDDVSIPQAEWQAILVTSANSVRALERLGAHRPLLSTPVLAVGPASTEAAQSAGFETVHNANGDLSALSQLASSMLEPGAGPLLYPSGTRISGDLKGQLEALGYACTRLPLYDAVAADGIPGNVARPIRSGQIDGVLLYSPRTAKNWASCTAKDAATDELQHVTHWCLSEAVAVALLNAWSGTALPPVQTPPEPNETSIIEAICAESEG